MKRLFGIVGRIVLGLFIFFLFISSPLWLKCVALVGFCAWGLSSIIHDAVESAIRNAMGDSLECMERMENHLERIGERISAIADRLGCEEDPQEEEDDPDSDTNVDDDSED